MTHSVGPRAWDSTHAKKASCESLLEEILREMDKEPRPKRIAPSPTPATGSEDDKVCTHEATVDNVSSGGASVHLVRSGDRDDSGKERSCP